MNEVSKHRHHCTCWLAPLLAALLPVAAYWLVLTPLLAKQQQTRAREIADSLQSWWSEQGRELTSKLQAMATSNTADELLLAVAGQRRNAPQLVDVAGQLMRQAGLDALTITNEQGRVISCGQLPGRQGEQDETLAGQLPEQSFWLGQLLVPRQGLASQVWVLQSVYERSHDGLGLRWHGGKVIDEAAWCAWQRLTGASLVLVDSGSGRELLSCETSGQAPVTLRTRLPVVAADMHSPLELLVSLPPLLAGWRGWLLPGAVFLGLLLALLVLVVAPRCSRENG